VKPPDNVLHVSLQHVGVSTLKDIPPDGYMETAREQPGIAQLVATLNINFKTDKACSNADLPAKLTLRNALC
jgi:hypothetical protein